MGKIAIIGFHNLHLMQFLYKYTQILDENNIRYDVLYWNRDNVSYPHKFKGDAICFEYPTSNYISKWAKLEGYLKCRSFFAKIIKQNHYDRIILLTTQTAVTLSSIALREYKGRYIFDFRDLTKERIPPYRKLVRTLIECSAFTAISSKGFIPFLGESDQFVMAHNCRKIHCIPCKGSQNLPLRIVFWGIVRQVDFQKRVCDFFGNDNRFMLFYHGEGATEELRKYCKEKTYQNISFTGRYLPDEIVEFAGHTDILMNLYENDEQMAYALTVKLYDALTYGLPMLVTKDSYMHQYIADRHFAYAFAFAESDKEQIIRWYTNRSDFAGEYEQFAAEINRDDENFVKRLLAFCTQ